MQEANEFLHLRIIALESELKRLQSELLKFSLEATESAKQIEVVIYDPNFDKPLSELNINY
jgi:hypothetical protein